MRRAPVAVVAALVLAGVGGWFTAERVQSPAQREAAAAAPPPRAVLTTVTSGVLSRQVSAQASVVRTASASYRVTTTASVPVVTQVLVGPGEQVAPGAAVLAVADRPVLVLPGAFALFRDLRAGDTGSDVRQVQAGLRAAGESVPSIEDGTFGQATALAVTHLYARAGFVPLTSEGGLLLPRAEVLVVTGALPAVVDAVPPVGTLLGDDTSQVVLASGDVVAHAQVAPGVAVTLRPGTPGYVQDAGGARVDVQVAAVHDADPATGAGASADLVPAAGGAFPAAWLGTSAVAVLTLQAVQDEGLIVPSRAVAVGADGTAHVVRFDGGVGHLVEVDDLGDLDGQSVVRPRRGGDLHAGDEVQVG